MIVAKPSRTFPIPVVLRIRKIKTTLFIVKRQPPFPKTKIRCQINVGIFYITSNRVLNPFKLVRYRKRQRFVDVSFCKGLADHTCAKQNIRQNATCLHQFQPDREVCLHCCGKQCQRQYQKKQTETFPDFLWFLKNIGAHFLLLPPSHFLLKSCSETHSITDIIIIGDCQHSGLSINRKPDRYRPYHRQRM